jgi:predicted RNA-binding Zn ribbon-like protein
MRNYRGPIRGEPLPIELHNTLYAVGGVLVDGFADAAGRRAWVGAIGDRLPFTAPKVDPSRFGDFDALREVVREVLHATLERRRPSKAALTELNRHSATAPRFEQLTQAGPALAAETRYQAATPTDALLGYLAAATIGLVGGPQAAELRACGAPGCVLMFLKEHPRREWCSTQCGNRARQARHYARQRGRDPTDSIAPPKPISLPSASR